MKPWACFKVALFAVAVIAYGALSFPKVAHAQSGCPASAEHDADPANFPYCNNPPAPPAPNPTPPGPGIIACFPNDVNGLQSALLATENLSGQQLYSIFLQLSAIYDGLGYAFQDQLHNQDLNALIRDNQFGGDQIAMNRWINAMGGGDGDGANFHFNTGDWTYYDANDNLVHGNFSGWSSC